MDQCQARTVPTDFPNAIHWYIRNQEGPKAEQGPLREGRRDNQGQKSM